jgi:diguanylate cyclase (GGDEF)-like protein
MNRFSLSVSVTLSVACAALVGVVALWWAADRGIAVQVLEDLGRRTLASAGRFREAAEAHPDEPDRALRALLRSPDVVGAAVQVDDDQRWLIEPPALAEVLEARRGLTTGMTTEVAGVPAVLVQAPLPPGDFGSALWVAYDRRPGAAHRREVRVWMAALGGLAVLLVVAAAGFVTSGIQTKLAAAVAAADRIAEGHRDLRMVPSGPREVRAVGDSLHALVETLRHDEGERERRTAELTRQLKHRSRELEQANRLLLDLANRDALTGLANRRRLELELERHVALSQRSHQPIGLALLDLDRFKSYNDTAGHLAGDALLRTVADALRSRARVTDLVVRWGGDEFCVLLPGTTVEGAMAAARDMVAAVTDAILALPLPEGLPRLGASAGVACWPDHGDDPSALVDRADEALYAAKQAGRGRVMCAGDR